MSEAPVVQWPGQRGRYNLRIYDVHSSWRRDAGGVYIFSRVINGYWRPLYIGQCQSFAERLCPAHHKWNMALQHGATHIHALVLDDESTRLAVERDLLAKHVTPCNEVLN